MNQNFKIFFWSLSAALGGFLFGFDTAVISGVEQTLQKLWDLSAFEHGVTVSIALIGTVVGSLIGGFPADKLGRKKSLLIIALLYLVSSMGTAYAVDWSVFLVFRFMGGLGVGVSSVVAPLYISEIAPAHKRGRLVAMFQFNIVLGILMAYLSNYLLSGIGENEWRWMLGVQAIPSLIFTITVLLIPESPRWLILQRGDISTARTILQEIDKEGTEQILASFQRNTTKEKVVLFQKAYNKPILLAVLFAVFNQVSGINAIIYFAPRIFEMAGIGKDSALLSSAGIGLINLISTLLGISLIDHFGRRILMMVGSVGLILTLILVSQAFFTQKMGMNVPFYLFAYIAFFAFSQGAVLWVFISEIFPNEVRANGQALGSFTHWLMASFITFTFPYFAETFGGGIVFAFFASMMVLQLLFAWKLMPETKGKSLENMDNIIIAH
jgi:SP family arabinose:H+ symporter-like MFS transporter